MIYRHPCIVKYIDSWQKNSKFYLAIEDVQPLQEMLPLNNYHIAVGLFRILKALTFLHENELSHNNISISSIYVSSRDGTWKLGGMEYLCKYQDLTPTFLKQSRGTRYYKAIDKNEKMFSNSCNKSFIDVYAFGVLANDLLQTEDTGKYFKKLY